MPGCREEPCASAAPSRPSSRGGCRGCWRPSWPGTRASASSFARSTPGRCWSSCSGGRSISASFHLGRVGTTVVGHAVGGPDHRPGAALHRAARPHRRPRAPAGGANGRWSWTISVRRRSSRFRPGATVRKMLGPRRAAGGIRSPDRVLHAEHGNRAGPGLGGARGSPSSRAARWRCRAPRSGRSRWVPRGWSAW